MPDADAAPGKPPIDAGLTSRLGISILHVTADRAVGTMPVEGNTQPYGLLHGGASAVLAESLGSLAAAAHAGEGRIAVGTDLSITHVRGVRAGVVTGTASAIHLGRTIAVYGITIVDAQGRTTASARLTCALRDREAT